MKDDTISDDDRYIEQNNLYYTFNGFYFSWFNEIAKMKEEILDKITENS